MHETGCLRLAAAAVVLVLAVPVAGRAQGVSGRLSVGPTNRVDNPVRAAAESGNLAAQFKLGYDLFYGGDVPRDPAQGMRWLARAADGGHAMAQYCLAQAFWVGDGVGVDLDQAARWMRRAAEQGHETAQFELGLMFLKGEGVPVDEAEARRWTAESQRQWSARQDRAREAGAPVEDRAQLTGRAAAGGAAERFRLAGDLMLGESGPRDYDEALKWFALAASAGDEESAQFRDWLGKKLPSARAAAALKAAREVLDAEQAPAATNVVASAAGPVPEASALVATNHQVVLRVPAPATNEASAPPVAPPDPRPDELKALLSDPARWVGQRVPVVAALAPDTRFSGNDPEGEWTSFSLSAPGGATGVATNSVLSCYHWMNAAGRSLYEAVRVARLAGRPAVFRLTVLVHPARQGAWPVEILSYEPATAPAPGPGAAPGTP